MYRFLLFVLLPALAVARCNREVMRLFFDRLDTDNNDSVDRGESDAFYKLLDTAGDKRLSLQDIKEVVDRLVPELKDDVEDLFELVDVDKDKVITPADVDSIYLMADTDRNDSVSLEEFDKLVKLYLLLACSLG